MTLPTLNIKLTQEEFDRLVQILDTKHKGDPDTEHLLVTLCSQYPHYPSDTPLYKESQPKQEELKPVQGQVPLFAQQPQ